MHFLSQRVTAPERIPDCVVRCVVWRREESHFKQCDAWPGREEKKERPRWKVSRSLGKSGGGPGAAAPGAVAHFPERETVNPGNAVVL